MIAPHRTIATPVELADLQARIIDKSIGVTTPGFEIACHLLDRLEALILVHLQVGDPTLEVDGRVEKALVEVLVLHLEVLNRRCMSSISCLYCDSWHPSIIDVEYSAGERVVVVEVWVALDQEDSPQIEQRADELRRSHRRQQLTDDRRPQIQPEVIVVQSMEYGNGSNSRTGIACRYQMSGTVAELSNLIRSQEYFFH